MKFGKAMNIVGAGMLAAEGIIAGTKRALGPGGKEFHTGQAGVPVWEDRNRANIGTKLNK
jgi:hypothetical protein